MSVRPYREHKAITERETESEVVWLVCGWCVLRDTGDLPCFLRGCKGSSADLPSGCITAGGKLILREVSLLAWPTRGECVYVCVKWLFCNDCCGTLLTVKVGHVERIKPGPLGKAHKHSE